MNYANVAALYALMGLVPAAKNSVSTAARLADNTTRTTWRNQADRTVSAKNRIVAITKERTHANRITRPRAVRGDGQMVKETR